MDKDDDNKVEPLRGCFHTARQSEGSASPEPPVNRKWNRSAVWEAPALSDIL